MTESIALSEIMPSPELQASLFKKMAGVMGRLQRLPKNGFNKHFNYPYVTDADVLEAVRTAMAEQGLCFFVDMGEVQQGNNRTLIPFTLTFADGESGATRTVKWVGESIDRQDKGINKAVTAAVKYALLKTFLISTGDQRDDPDQGPSASEKAQGSGGNGNAGEAPTQVHWIDKISEKGPVRDRFNSFLKEQGFTPSEALHKLGVTDIHDYTGSMGNAIEALTKKEPNPGPVSHSWPASTIQPLMEKGLADHPKHLINRLNLSTYITPEDGVERVEQWLAVYQTWKNGDAPSEKCAAEADVAMRTKDEGAEEKAPSPGTPVDDEDIPF